MYQPPKNTEDEIQNSYEDAIRLSRRQPNWLNIYFGLYSLLASRRGGCGVAFARSDKRLRTAGKEGTDQYPGREQLVSHRIIEEEASIAH
jgi:hypothetical protein